MMRSWVGLVSSVLVACEALAFVRPGTTRRYLQGPLSERLLVFYSEGKIVFGENVHARDWQQLPYGAQTAHSFWLLDGNGEPLDFTTPKMRDDANAAPILGYTWNLDGLELDFEACSPIERKSTAFCRVTLVNRGKSALQRELSFMLRTGKEKELLYGAPDFYVQYDPFRTRERWNLVPATWKRGAQGEFRDGERFVKVVGQDELTWDESRGFAKFAVKLAPGERKTIEVTIGKGETVKTGYEAARQAAREGWAKELQPVAGRSPLLQHLTVQMLQCMAHATEGDFILPRQGGLQRWVWPWDFSAVPPALLALGYRDYVKGAVDFIMSYASASGEIGPFGNGWAGDTAYSLHSFAYYCQWTHDREFYLRHRESARRAVKWILSRRAADGLYPAMKVCDWKEHLRNWSMTDVPNVKAIEMLAAAAEALGDDWAKELRAQGAEYRAAVERALDQWRQAAKGKDTFFIPTTPDGKGEALSRQAAIFNGVAGIFAEAGYLTGEEMVRAYRHLVRAGLASDEGLAMKCMTDKITHIWYTTASERDWYLALRRVGRDAEAKKFLDAMLKYAITKEFITGERIHDENPWINPWSPNDSGAGRIAQMLLYDEIAHPQRTPAERFTRESERLRQLPSRTLKAGETLNTGFFMDIRPTGNLRLAELVGYSRDDPMRGLKLAAVADCEVRLRCALPSVAISAEGVRELPLESTGLRLKARQPVIVRTRLSAAEVSPRMNRDRFLISAYSGVSQKCPASFDDAHLKLIADADFDFIASSLNATDRPLLDRIHRHRLGCFTRDFGVYFSGGWDEAKVKSKLPMANFERFAADLKGRLRHPAIWRIDYFDEPSSLAFGYLGEIAAYMTRECPEIPGHVNLFPSYASVIENSSQETASQLGCYSYQEYIDRYCERVPLDYIEFDHYIYSDNRDYVQNTRYNLFVTNLTIVADACRRTGRSFWFMGQIVNRKNNFIRLSANKLRYQVYAAMAYGCEHMSWACWAPCWWNDSVIEVDGTVSDHYGKFCTVNRECHRLGETYMRYRNVASRVEAAEDGSRLMVGDMVSRVRDDPATATFVFAADDIMDEKHATHRIYLKDAAAKRVVGVDGDIRIEQGADGRRFFQLQDNRPAMILK